MAEILHNDGFARLTRNNKELRMIYPNFGTHPNEQLIFGIQPSERFRSKLIYKNFDFIFNKFFKIVIREIIEIL